MKYSSFKAEEFCEDADFIRWVVSPTDETNHFWNAFVANYPNKAREIQIATEYVKMLRFREFEPTVQDINRLKQRIWNDIETPVLTARRWNQFLYWAAASVALVIVWLGALWLRNQPTSYQTAFGQIQKIELLDGSIVTLNAHSSLKVANNLSSASTREVWLDGEAYFDIAKLNGAKFIVHTAEARVEVLGTEFNVSTRRKQTKVILHEGKVRLHAAFAKPLIMKPGDMATVLDKNQPIQLKLVKPEQYDVWKESLVVLDNKSVSEIAEMLEDGYGISLEFEDSALLDKKLSGKLSLKSIDDFVYNLATSLDATAEKTEKGYVFR